MLKRLIFPFFISFMIFSVAGAFAAEASPTERVKEGSDKLIEILSNPDLQAPDKHDAAIAELRKAAEQYIDFRTTTMYAVGKPWLKMSKQMQDDLTEAFIQLLERSYLKRIPTYSGQKISYTKELVQGKKAKVFTEIIDKDKKIIVEFRLRDTGAQWMIYDVVAEGVSLVANYRSQFSKILDNGTPEELLKLIRERIEKLDKGEDDTEPENAQG